MEFFSWALSLLATQSSQVLCFSWSQKFKFLSDLQFSAYNVWACTNFPQLTCLMNITFMVFFFLTVLIWELVPIFLLHNVLFKKLINKVKIMFGNEMRSEKQLNNFLNRPSSDKFLPPTWHALISCPQSAWGVWKSFTAWHKLFS